MTWPKNAAAPSMGTGGETNEISGQRIGAQSTETVKPSTSTEWRVSYRRIDSKRQWTSSKVYQSFAPAMKCLWKLASTEQYGLGKVVALRLERRQVPQWDQPQDMTMMIGCLGDEGRQ